MLEKGDLWKKRVEEEAKSLTVFTFSSNDTNEGGKLTKQFLRWTSESSAARDCPLLLGAILL
jgi:hypothetical protein